MTVWIEPEYSVVEEDDLKLAATRGSSFPKKIDELYLDFDVVRTELEILAEIADRDVESARLQRPVGLPLECFGYAIRLNRMYANE
jgi:hypothetical protein